MSVVLSKTARFLFSFSLVCLIVGMLAFNALVIWVATGPRTLEKLSPYIEKSLTPPDGRFTVHIGRTLLLWDGWKHPIDIRLGDVVVKTREGRTFSSFPEVKIGLDIPSLILGKVMLRSLVVDKPVIRLFQDENFAVSFGPQDESAELQPPAAEERLPVLSLLAPLVSSDGDSPLRKLRSVRIGNAYVKVIGQGKGVFFEATDVNLRVRRAGDTLEMLADARVRYEEYQSSLQTRFLIDRDQPVYDGYLEFKGVEPQSLLRLFTGRNDLDPLRIALSGTSHLVISSAGEVERMQFSVEGGDGELTIEKLPKLNRLDWLHAEGQMSRGFSEIQFNKLQANIGGAIAQAQGQLSLIEGGDMALQGTLSAKDIPASMVDVLWPQGVSPMSREWVTTNISGGKVSQLDAKADIKPGDLQKPLLPKEAVDVSMAIEKVDIRYLAEHPEVKNLSGLIRIDGVTLDAAVESAEYMSGTKLSSGRVLIEDLNADNPYIKVSLAADSPAKDLARFLGLPRLRHAGHLNIDEKQIEGSAKGTASVGFSFFAPRGEDGKPLGEAPIDYEVKAQVSGVGQPGFMNKFDLRNVAGDLSVDKSGVVFSGGGEVNGAKINASTVKYLFQPEKGYDTFIEVKASAPVESLPRFGYPALSFASGDLGIDASAKLGPEMETAAADIDLAQASVNLASLKWVKPLKEPAAFSLSVEKKKGVASIPSFHLKGREVDVKGSASLSADMKDIAAIDARDIRFGATKLQKISYSRNAAGGYAVDVQGEKLDLGDYFSQEGGEGFSFEAFPAVEFKADISQLVLSPEGQIANFKGDVSCSASLCERAALSGVAVEPFNIRILRSPKGTRQFSLHAQDAGGFLKAIGLFGGMEGGDLSITGNYGDAKSAGLRGRIDINRHVIKDAPVLAKILSLASLTGFFDTLQGKGIAFDKLSGRFSLANDVIRLDDVRTHGSAMGMTVEGTITMPRTLLDLQGTIVPSYTLNSALSDVPLVGGLLTGGKGEGVFAARYSVKGDDKNPDVSVNPLSILTPGFLRGLFDIGSSKKSDEE